MTALFCFKRAMGLGLAIALASGAEGSLPGGANPQDAPQMTLTDLTALGQNGRVVINTSAGKPLTVLPLNSPPINGFIPRFAVSLTTEQDQNDFLASPSFYTVGNPGTVDVFPYQAPPYYVAATFDTGAQAHIFTYDDSYGAGGFFIDQGFPSSITRYGGEPQPISGASGTEIAEISDGLGAYVTGLNNATGGTQVSVPNGTLLQGHSNFSVLTAAEDSALPNIIGAPLLANYQVKIQNSLTRSITVNGETLRSPSLTVQTVDTALPAGFVRLTLDPAPAGAPPETPFFFPDFAQSNWANNPTSPSTWVSLTAKATVTHSGTAGSQDFLFDTGAQVTVMSQDTAAACGITGSTTPDFFVEILGVGGTTTEVPGFYVNSLSVLTTGVGGGTITFTNVPILMLDLPDPRDGTGFIPGILGMNLFTDRDLILNGGTTAQWVGIGPLITSQWTATGGGTWGDDTKWSLGSPDGADVPANFLSSITAPSTVTVDSVGFTVGSMKFDNANRYTIAGPGTVRLEALSTGTAQINVVTGSHTVSAPLELLSDTTITVTPGGGSLNLAGTIDGGSVSITKAGAGLLAVSHVRAGALVVNQGAVRVNSNGTNAGASRVTSLTIAGGTTPTAKLDLTNNAMVIDYSGGSPIATISAQIKVAFNGGSWNGNGITSSSAAATSASLHKTAIGFAEGSAFGSPSSWFGQSSDSTSLLFRYVYSGDANIDGTVDTTDFNLLAANFGGVVKYWYQGDFNYDNTVDTLDFNALASNFSLILPGDSLGSVIPEPACVVGVLFVSALLRRNRPR